MSSKIPHVFPILTYIDANPVFASHGSAFFINGDGYFITAAHTFKNPGRKYFAYINEVYYEITEIWREYKDMDQQEAPVYQDLLIGKVDLPAVSEFFTTGNSDEMLAGEEMILKGYNFNNYGTAPTQDDMLAFLFEDGNDTDDENAKQLNENEIKISSLKYGNVPTFYVRSGFNPVSEYEDQRINFQNGFTHQTKALNIGGYSGGPLLYENMIVGMLIGKKAAISINYILETLNPIFESISKNLPPAGYKTPIPEHTWLTEINTSMASKITNNSSALLGELQNFFVIANEDVPKLIKSPSAIILEGFGGNQSNYRLAEEAKLIHLIVMNKTMMDEAGLDKQEMEAVLTHEFGHVLNRYPASKIPAPGEEKEDGSVYTMDDINEIRYQDRLLNEKYADNFALQQGLTDPLISSLEKYSKLTGSSNHKMIADRIDFLTSGAEPLVGTVRPLNIKVIRY